MTTTYRLKLDRVTMIVVTFILALATAAIMEDIYDTKHLEAQNDYLREKLTECINLSPHHMAESVFDDAGKGRILEP